MNDTAASYSSTPLPKPRKLPKQGRSRILVQSLKQACLQILLKEGHKALTATRIANVSGVAMGSLYQYFPNVDAIVVATIEDLVRARGENPSELQHSHYPDRFDLIDILLQLSLATQNQNASDWAAD